MVFGDSRITNIFQRLKSFQLMPGLNLRNRVELAPSFSLDFQSHGMNSMHLQHG